MANMMRRNCSRGCCLVDNRPAENRAWQAEIDNEFGPSVDREYECRVAESDLNELDYYARYECIRADDALGWSLPTEV